MMRGLHDRDIVNLWEGHTERCEKCKRVDPEKASTLALCCAEGAKLLRDYLVVKEKPNLAAKRREERERAKRARGQFFCSKAKAKALMKFVE